MIELVKKDKEAILFVDEIHTLVKAGDSNDGANNAGNIIKPYLSRGEITIIGATTDDEYHKHIENEKAFARRFNKVNFPEPGKEETKVICRGLKKVEEEFFGKEIADELIDKVVDLSSKYTLDQANPAKSIAMLDLAFAYSKTMQEENKEVNLDDVMNSVKLKYDIHITDSKYKDTKLELGNRVLGQDGALKKIFRNLRTADSGIVDPDRPLFSMILAGPSGTGKTFSAEIIAEKFFGSKEKNLIKISMGEYASEMDVSKLVGSAPGYIGSDEDPALIKHMKQNPASVVLFDEVEKAHPTVFKAMLNILDKGIMTDNKGNKVSFKNAIIIFTTNAGYTHDFAKPKGVGFFKEPGKATDINEALKKYFSPEFLGRIDDVVVFETLQEDVMDKLIERERNFYNEQSGLSIKFSKKDIKEIKENANIAEAGARGLKRAVRNQMVEILAGKEEE